MLCVIRQVPDAEARIKTAGAQVNLEGTTLALDGMDEYGVEQALILAGELGGETVAVAIGPNRFEEAIRRALAMGLDRAIHVETTEPLDTLSTAQVLARVVQEEQPDIVFVGGQHADTDSQAMGAALAEALGWVQSTWTTKLEIEAGQVRATHDTDDGKETIEFSLPAVITTQQGLNEPRYPTLPNIMKAKKKEISKRNLEEFGAKRRVQITDEQIQERARLGRIIDGKDAAAASEELIRLLNQEAKVIG